MARGASLFFFHPSPPNNTLTPKSPPNNNTTPHHNKQPPTARNICLAHGSLDAFFRDVLGADVVCLQEVKLSRDKIAAEYALVDGYEVC